MRLLVLQILCDGTGIYPFSSLPYCGSYLFLDFTLGRIVGVEVVGHISSSCLYVSLDGPSLDPRNYRKCPKVYSSVHRISPGLLFLESMSLRGSLGNLKLSHPTLPFLISL